MYFYEEMTNSSDISFLIHLNTYYSFYVHLKIIKFFCKNLAIWELRGLFIICRFGHFAGYALLHSLWLFFKETSCHTQSWGILYTTFLYWKEFSFIFTELLLSFLFLKYCQSDLLIILQQSKFFKSCLEIRLLWESFPWRPAVRRHLSLPLSIDRLGLCFTLCCFWSPCFMAVLKLLGKHIYCICP